MNRETYLTGTPWEPVVGYSRAVKVIRPATSMVEVSRLITPEILVEIEADAVVQV
jgi:enamine deaminase RidA (YjgF/YER057c/UK114 family)